jgi:predicted nucleic acid-binding protein
MSPSLINCALELSYAYDVPVFDAYFVATALRRKCRFVTADRKAYHRMSGLSFVELL